MSHHERDRRFATSRADHALVLDRATVSRHSSSFSDRARFHAETRRGERERGTHDASACTIDRDTRNPFLRARY